MERGLRYRTSTLYVSRFVFAAPRARARAVGNQCNLGFSGAGFSSGSTQTAADSLLDLFGPCEMNRRSSKMDLS